MCRQTLIVPLRAGSFPSVIEKPVIVILVLKWDDLVVDECVEALEMGLEIRWEFEIHDGRIDKLTHNKWVTE